MESELEFSVHVSNALDCLGKSDYIVKYRIEQYKQKERQLTFNYKDFYEVIIAGSKGEGLTAPLESDSDMMVVDNNDVICAEDVSPFAHFAGFTVFEAERRYTSPGYTQLRLDRFEGTITQENIIDSLVPGKNGQLYLSSNCFIEYYKNLFNVSLESKNLLIEISGPSHGCSGRNGYLNQDFVIAFRCMCRHIKSSFFTRPRNYGWPSNNQLLEISSLEGHVVPVGYKGSQTAFLEWRICYTKAERFLMHCINDTQRKLYVLLKMVSKTYISSICKEITSYVLKNVVFWLAECSDPESFMEVLLVNKLIQALAFLRRCVIDNNLPNYMIPERNQFSEKLSLVQRHQLIVLLTELIDAGGKSLMGIERLRGTMIVLYKEPVEAERFKCKRNMIEKLYLYTRKTMNEFPKENRPQLLSRDEAYKNITKTIICLVVPEWPSLFLQGYSFNSLVCIGWERQKQWLS